MIRAQSADHQQHQSEGDIPGSCRLQQAAQALAEAEAICKAQGAKLTPIRRQILEALHTARKPLGAYELAEALAPAGRRMPPITAYRTLEFLIEQGLAHRLASQNAYIATFNGPKGSTAITFLICEECGGVNEATSPELAEAMAGLLQAQSFRPRIKVLEVTGRCAHCQDTH